jgi:predicted GNAT family acetyltransferase
MEGLLLYTGRVLFPVFGPSGGPEAFRNFPLPFNGSDLHAMQGLASDLAPLEGFFERRNIRVSEGADYDLMSLELRAAAELRRAGNPPPRGLLFRRPVYEDVEGLFPLQRGYEQEEVLPAGAEFNAAACRVKLERLVGQGRILIAERNGIMAGKININAESFTRLQIGGIYVAPEFRGQGIAQDMLAAFIGELLPLGKHFTLFVRKKNPAARRVYDKAGFTKTADYKIDYFL